jgi:hypothetical protein
MAAIATDLTSLLLLPLAVACASWTVTKEEVFRELREWCKGHISEQRHPLLVRKLCYLPTCEYCFSHWVTILFLLLTGFRLLLPGWAGFIVALFVIVFLANLYMTLYATCRNVLKYVQTAAANKA